MEIRFIYDESIDKYTLEVNEEVVMECLSEEEARKLTINEIAEMLW